MVNNAHAQILNEISNESNYWERHHCYWKFYIFYLFGKFFLFGFLEQIFNICFFRRLFEMWPAFFTYFLLFSTSKAARISFCSNSLSDRSRSFLHSQLQFCDIRWFLIYCKLLLHGISSILSSFFKKVLLWYKSDRSSIRISALLVLEVPFAFTPRKQEHHISALSPFIFLYHFIFSLLSHKLQRCPL